MPERPVQQHSACPQRHANDAFLPRPDTDSPVCLTLRVGGTNSAQARASLEHLLRDIPGLLIMTVSHHRGTATLALQASRDELDTVLHRIMASVAGAEFGPIQPAVLAAVH